MAFLTTGYLGGNERLTYKGEPKSVLREQKRRKLAESEETEIAVLHEEAAMFANISA